MKTASKQSSRLQIGAEERKNAAKVLFDHLAGAPKPSVKSSLQSVRNTKNRLTTIFAGRNSWTVPMIEITQGTGGDHPQALSALSKSTKKKQTANSKKTISEQVDMVAPDKDLVRPPIALQLDRSKGTAHFVAVESQPALERIDRSPSQLLQWYLNIKK